MMRNICHIIYIIGLLSIFIIEFKSIPEIPNFPKRAGGWFEGSAIIARNEGLFTTSLFTALYNPSKNSSGRNHRYNWNLYHKNKKLPVYEEKDVYLSALRLDKQLYVIIDYALYKLGWKGSNHRTLKSIALLFGLVSLYHFGRLMMFRFGFLSSLIFLLIFYYSPLNAWLLGGFRFNFLIIMTIAYSYKFLEDERKNYYYIILLCGAFLINTTDYERTPLLSLTLLLPLLIHSLYKMTDYRELITSLIRSSGVIFCGFFLAFVVHFSMVFNELGSVRNAKYYMEQSFLKRTYNIGNKMDYDYFDENFRMSPSKAVKKSHKTFGLNSAVNKRAKAVIFDSYSTPLILGVFGIFFLTNLFVFIKNGKYKVGVILCFCILYGYCANIVNIVIFKSHVFQHDKPDHWMFPMLWFMVIYLAYLVPRIFLSSTRLKNLNRKFN